MTPVPTAGTKTTAAAKTQAVAWIPRTTFAAVKTFLKFRQGPAQRWPAHAQKVFKADMVRVQNKMAKPVEIPAATILPGAAQASHHEAFASAALVMHAKAATIANTVAMSQLRTDDRS